MSNSDSPAGTTGGPVTLPGLGDLPEKLRVHALAKLLGRTSREVMAALLELGFAARSVQSSVDRKTAEQVAVVLVPELAGGAEPSPAQAQPAEPEAAASPTAGSPAADSGSGGSPSVTEHQPSPDEPPAAALAPLFAPPAPVFQPPARRTRRRAEAETDPRTRRPRRRSRLAAAAAVRGPSARPLRTDVSESRSTRRTRRSTSRSTGRATRSAAEPDDGLDDRADDESARAAPAASGAGAVEAGAVGAAARATARSSTTTPTATPRRTTTPTTPTRPTRPTRPLRTTRPTEPTSPTTPRASRRRRRRRRRRGSGDDAWRADDESDPPNTVVKVRAPRERSDDTDGDGVQSVRGSTRLEAKRQRRRDGRDAGRRRVPILSEAEFLARRESVERSMVVRERGERVEIGVLEDERARRALRHQRRERFGIGHELAGRQHLPRPRAERAAEHGGRVRRHRPRPQRRALRRRGRLGRRRPRRPRPPHRAGAVQRRQRARAGHEGPGRAQGRPADHADQPGRAVPGLRPLRRRRGDQPQAARRRAQAAEGPAARDRPERGRRRSSAPPRRV